MRLALICLALLAACSTAPGGPSPQPVVSQGACGAEGYAGLTGANIAATTLPADLWFRVLYPDTVTTQEYAAERLNFAVDDTGTILRVYCG